jgi:transcriptional regulator with GAF, ATPase, and Fis domain
VVLLGPSAFATDSHASSGSGSSGGGGPAPLRNASPAATVPTDPESLADLPLPEALERWERARIVAALRAAGGVQAEAARRLGVSRGNLHQRIQRLGIVRRDVDYG